MKQYQSEKYHCLRCGGTEWTLFYGKNPKRVLICLCETCFHAHEITLPNKPKKEANP